MYLASCGDDAVSLHPLPSYSVECIQMRDTVPYRYAENVSWNKDGSSLAAVHYNSNGVVEIISCKEDGTTASQLAGVLLASAACFMKTKTSYVAIGTRNGDIVIWDCNTDAELKTFKACDSAINLIDFSANDIFYATATGRSNISVFQCNSNQKISTNKFTGSSLANINYTTLRFHPSEEAILGAASSKGIVALWDVTLKKETYTVYKFHRTYCTDFVFSKVNKNFMTSVGFDKILLGHDLLQTKPAFEITAKYPISCLDMTSDGNTVALGTVMGEVHVYDLRAASSPLHVVKTCKSRVKRVAYSPEKSFPAMTNTISTYEEIQGYTRAICNACIKLKKNTMEASSSMQKRVETCTHQVEDVTHKVEELTHKVDDLTHKVEDLP